MSVKLPSKSRVVDRVEWRLRLMKLRLQGQRRVALASFPRSGNTWFRFLLESATGELTGTAGKREGRMLPRANDGLVIKTHQSDSHRYTHGIHLVRNPFDVMDSYYDWKASCGWQWKYGEMDWDGFVKLMVPLWCAHTRHWFDAGPSTFRIRYEDCLKEPIGQFGALLEWLGRPVQSEALRAAVESTSFERLKRAQVTESAVADKFFRRGSAGKGIQRFSQEQRQWVASIARVELERCGYAALVDQQ
jgi:hypothetical protein